MLFIGLTSGLPRFDSPNLAFGGVERPTQSATRQISVGPPTGCFFGSLWLFTRVLLGVASHLDTRKWFFVKTGTIEGADQCIDIPLYKQLARCKQERCIKIKTNCHDSAASTVQS